MDRFGLFPFRSPLLGESRLISSPRGTEMFQFPRFASLSGCIAFDYAGCPIRESAVRKPVSSLPQLIAAYHALHRLPSPRHPPHALSSLIAGMNSLRQRRNTPVESIIYLLVSFWGSDCQRANRHGLRPWSGHHQRVAELPLPMGCREVELSRLELPTSGLQSPRSPN